MMTEAQKGKRILGFPVLPCGGLELWRWRGPLGARGQGVCDSPSQWRVGSLWVLGLGPHGDGALAIGKPGYSSYELNRGQVCPAADRRGVDTGWGLSPIPSRGRCVTVASGLGFPACRMGPIVIAC